MKSTNRCTFGSDQEMTIVSLERGSNLEREGTDRQLEKLTSQQRINELQNEVAALKSPSTDVPFKQGNQL